MAGTIAETHICELIVRRHRYSAVLKKRASADLCFLSIHDLRGGAPLGLVDIFREPTAVQAIVELAITRQAKVVWMQLGVIHEEAAQRAHDAGLEVVMDRCIKIEHARFFGGLNTVGLNTGVISALRLPRRLSR